MNTLHLISHTHWDREWYQTFQQFRLHLVHMIDGLLYILDTDPQYQHFMLDGQTIVLEDYLQIRPEREADLRKYIQNGRILIGPWYLMPDEFLVSPEAIIHNFLEGDRIARQFGPKMMVGYIPDTFGHIGQMPQIRAVRSGVSKAWRPRINASNRRGGSKMDSRAMGSRTTAESNNSISAGPSATGKSGRLVPGPLPWSPCSGARPLTVPAGRQTPW